MKKNTVKIALLALVVMLALSGCNLVRTDPAYIAQQKAEEEARELAAKEADLAQVVASFNGGTVTKGEILDDFNEQLASFIGYVNANNQMISLFGGQTQSVTKANVEDLRQYVAVEAVQRKVLENKIVELGLEAVTEEERAAIAADAAENYRAIVSSYVAQGMPEEYAAEQLSYQGVTERMMGMFAYDDYLEERLSPVVNAETAVSEEEVAAKYAQLVEEDQDLIQSSIVSFEDKVQNGETVYFMPEDAKFVKQVFLMPGDEVKAARTEAETAVTRAKNQLKTLEKKQGEGEDVAAEIEAKNAEIAEAEADLKAAEDAVWADVNERLTKVQEALAAGEAFEAVQEAYNDDNQHNLESVYANGYLVCAASKNWDAAFSEAVAALENVGDVSEAFLGSVGVHIVMYASQPEAGETGLEAVKAEVEAIALSEKKDAAYDEAVAKWMEEADAQYDFSGWKL